jgi:murein DD-endopeptidase MepM/ murein hydrolase activator NlpD
VLNGQPRSPHKGLDFRAAAGDPIACVADGTVVLTGDFYYPGQFAVVDHGLGVTSIYMHLSAIVAEKGRAIKKGEIVGLAGSTGRATGPHLHLGFTVLGLSVDAFPLLDTTAEDKALYAEAFSGAAKAGTSGAGKKIAAPKAATAKKQPASGGGAKSGGRDKGKKQGTKQ